MKVSEKMRVFLPDRHQVRATWRRSGRGCRRASDERLALLAHELRQVMRAERVLASRAGIFPAAETLHAGPRACCRSASAIAVGHARFDALKEFALLVFD